MARKGPTAAIYKFSFVSKQSILCNDCFNIVLCKNDWEKMHLHIWMDFFGNTQKAILCLSNNGCLLYDSYVGPFLNMIPFDIGISGKGSFKSKSLMWLIKMYQITIQSSKFEWVTYCYWGKFKFSAQDSDLAYFF